MYILYVLKERCYMEYDYDVFYNHFYINEMSRYQDAVKLLSEGYVFKWRENPYIEVESHSDPMIEGDIEYVIETLTEMKNDKSRIDLKITSHTTTDGDYNTEYTTTYISWTTQTLHDISRVEYNAQLSLKRARDIITKYPDGMLWSNMTAEKYNKLYLELLRSKN